MSTDPIAGPVVIRGQQIGGPGQVAFEGGLVSGTSSFLYLAGDSGVSSPGAPTTWQQWPSYTDFTGPGCYLFQVDGIEFTEQIVVAVGG
jgi:hypothetical protein